MTHPASRQCILQSDTNTLWNVNVKTFSFSVATLLYGNLTIFIAANVVQILQNIQIRLREPEGQI